MSRLVRTGWVLSLLIGSAACALTADEKLTKAEIAKRGKAASVLVEVKGHGTGSGFCVHPSGLFVTNEHVVRNTEQVTLVLNSGLKGQRVLSAKVVRTNKDRDLALLRADEAGQLAALPLGSANDATELAEVVAVGFPFGRALALDAKEYPTVSVNAGSVTSLRRKAGLLDAIQLDVALTYGNSGGPVLDDRGRILGVVRGGVPGTGVNMAIPVTHLADFLAAPDLSLTPPTLTPDALGKPAQFKARVAILMPGAPKPEVRLVLQAGDEEPREFPMKKQDGAFVATAVPVARSAAEVRPEVTIRFAAGLVVGQASDIELGAGGKAVKLSAVRRVEFKPSPRVILADGGAVIEGEVTGLKSIVVTVGGQKLTLDLSAAEQVQVQPTAAVMSVTATVVASVGGKEVARSTSSVPVRGAGAVATADPTSVVIKPPEMTGDVVTKRLPEPFADAVLGGGGRYLIFHLPKLKKLAVFDVNEARVTRYIPLAEDKIAYAAGLDAVVIALPKQGALERWSLTTYEREAVVKTALNEEIRDVVMGHASNGPVLVNGHFYDLATLKPVQVQADKETIRLRPPSVGTAARVLRAEAKPLAPADGTLYSAWHSRGSPQQSTVYALQGNELKSIPSYGSWGHLVPGADGSWVATANGIVSSTLSRSSPEDEKLGYSLPSVRGNYILTLDPGKGMAVYLRGEARPLAKLNEAKHGLNFNSWDREEFGAWQRAFLMPDANVIAILPESNDQVVLHRFDLDAALAKSGLDYLLVTSQAPRTARVGTTYTYSVTVKAKHAPVAYKLDTAPTGMTVSKEGAVSWAVPADAEGDQDVVLTVRDTAGQEVFHTFRVRVTK